LVDVARIRELGAGLSEDTLGRGLFELAAAARVKDLDPEGALRKETVRVMREVEVRVGGASA
jgi:XTP/dITP diphosphohydrolase/tetrapyrrole methylase family protein/MazG family protein